MNLFIKKLNTEANIPSQNSKFAAGYDLYACIKKYMIVHPNETVTIPTGIAVSIPVGYAGFVYARSGLATKYGLRPANCVGVIDSDYRGEIIVALHNDSKNSRIIEVGDRIAQLVVSPVATLEFDIADELETTDRGEGGFGSTGR